MNSEQQAVIDAIVSGLIERGRKELEDVLKGEEDEVDRSS